MAENISVVQKFKVDEEYRKDFIYGVLVGSGAVCAILKGIPMNDLEWLAFVLTGITTGAITAEHYYRKRLAKSE